MYVYLLSPIVAFIIAQGIKVWLRSKSRKITWHDLFSYSDMPSGHTAVVISLVSIIALRQGIESPIFACACVYAMIVITDAIGLRNYLGSHGKTLNVLVDDLKEDDFLDRRYPKQLEKIGHTPLQVLIGALIGAMVSLTSHLLF